MITVNSQLAQELGLTYWQLAGQKTAIIYQLSHEEKELLQKILQAKAIKLTDDIMTVEQNQVVQVTTKSHLLSFDDVSQTDENNIIYLAKLADMLKDNELKKLTWYKLKNINFY